MMDETVVDAQINELRGYLDASQNQTRHWRARAEAVEAKLAEVERELQIERDLRGQAQRAASAAEAREKALLADLYQWQVRCVGRTEADVLASNARRERAALAAGKDRA